ncbi:MAG: patatin-like phospholipase family protein [Bacteroidetes bacterium]|nr:patatin-like phospholipase family protein [Bacteroidota bacterium]
MSTNKTPQKALVLSGGSILGAFQAGAIKQVLESGFQPDIIMGISAGALNSSFLVNEAGKMNGSLSWPEIGNALRNFWLNNVQKPQDLLYRRSKVALALQFLTHRFNGWFDYTPLVKLIQKELKLTHLRNSPVELMVGAVDWTEGDIEYPDKAHPQLIDFIIASASIPVILPAWSINDRPYVDGGIRDVTPLSQVIDKGIEEIVVILTQPAKMAESKGKATNLLNFLERIINIMLNEILLNDLLTLNKINQEVLKFKDSNKKPTGILENKRFIKCTIIRPKQAYDFQIQNFTDKDIQQLISDGEKVASEVILS